MFDFLPSVRLQSQAEYYKDLTRGTAYVNSVGDEVYASGSQYQNTYSIRADMTLWDFGVRAKRMEMAELDVLASLEGERKALLELKLAVLDEYTAACMAATEVRMRREMLPMLEEVHEILQRTFKAGLTDKVSVIEAQVEVDRARGEILEQEHELESRLANLSFFTGEQYLVDDVGVADLPEPGEMPDSFNAEAHPDVRRLDREIAKKEAEASMSRRSMLPVVSMYSRYSYYGTDPNSFDRAREDVTERGYNVGVVAILPITEGTRGVVSVRRAVFEVSKLRAEHAKLVAELDNSFRKIEAAYSNVFCELIVALSNKSKMLEEIGALSRMWGLRMEDRERFVMSKVSLVKELINVEMQKISKSAIIQNAY